MITSMTMRYFLVSGSLHLKAETKKQQINNDDLLTIPVLADFDPSLLFNVSECCVG